MFFVYNALIGVKLYVPTKKTGIPSFPCKTIIYPLSATRFYNFFECLKIFKPGFRVPKTERIQMRPGSSRDNICSGEKEPQGKWICSTAGSYVCRQSILLYCFLTSQCIV